MVAAQTVAKTRTFSRCTPSGRSSRCARARPHRRPPALTYCARAINQTARP